MIKSKGDYLAVKVQRGGRDFRREGAAILWDYPGWDGVDVYVLSGSKFEFRIIGLISEMEPETWMYYQNFFHIPSEELDQWLIIKKL